MEIDYSNRKGEDVVRYAKVELFYDDESQGGYVNKSERLDLSELIHEGEVGHDSYRITIVEMTEEEIAALPEFDGF